jgi:DHA2 family multidrug resistance protein
VPQFLQQVQGHTAQQAGLILLPGALFTGLMLPLVARLMGRTDARLVIGVGMMALIGSMFLFWSRLTLTMPDGAFLMPLILRGIGTGLQLVPLSIVALGTLPPTQVAEGAGLYNLFRQLGGSLGIAMLTTLLDRREHYHYARMMEHLTAANAAVGPRLAKAQSILVAHGASPANASRAALGLLERTIDRQANVLAFQDVFLALLCVAAGTILLLALFQRPQGVSRPSADVH